MSVPSVEVIEFTSGFTARFETLSNGSKVSCPPGSKSQPDTLNILFHFALLFNLKVVFCSDRFRTDKKREFKVVSLL